MRVEHVATWLILSLIALGCAEQPVCAEGRVRGRETVVVQCSTGKVPVCGDDPAQLYDENSGALLPTSPLPDITDPAMRAAYNGSCDGVTGPCRPRPACQGAAGDGPTCVGGLTPYCVLGRVVEAEGPMPPPPPPEDAGPGDEDAGPGDEDAGPGDEDAGPGEVDAGFDAGTDAGP